MLKKRHTDVIWQKHFKMSIHKILWHLKHIKLNHLTFAWFYLMRLNLFMFPDIFLVSSLVRNCSARLAAFGLDLGLWTPACQVENITILVVTSCRYKIAFQNNREEFHLQHIVLQFYIPLNINFNFRTSYLFVS